MNIKTKEKLISKTKQNLIFNFKGNRSGITLVSLVITIVIMLILAGVSISFIIGQNGLFTKAEASSKAYSKEAIKEELQLASNSAYLNDTNDDITNQMIADEMKNDLSEINWKNKDGLVGTYKGYNFYIDENKNVVIGDKYVEPDPVEILNTNIGNVNNATCYSKYREQINSVEFKIDSNPTYPSSALSGMQWDVSKAHDGSIIAYLENSNVNNVPYNLTIVGKSKIKLPKNSSYFFYYYENLNSFTGFDKLDYSEVEDMSYFFSFVGYYANAMKDMNLTGFDTSHVTTMNQMFYAACYYGTETINLGDKFDTSNVTSMAGMFQSCSNSNLKSINLGDKFNTSKVTNMYYMFYQFATESTSFTNLKLGNKFDTSKVTNMERAFYQCGKAGMTDFNLGTAFIIPTSAAVSDEIFYDIGKSACIIHCSQGQLERVKTFTYPRSVDTNC